MLDRGFTPDKYSFVGWLNRHWGPFWCGCFSWLRFICCYNSEIHLYFCKTSWFFFFFLDNLIVTTVRGGGFDPSLLIMESKICHWATNLLTGIMKVILLSMISILPTCLYLIFIWSSGFFFLVICVANSGFADGLYFWTSVTLLVQLN